MCQICISGAGALFARGRSHFEGVFPVHQRGQRRRVELEEADLQDHRQI